MEQEYQPAITYGNPDNSGRALASIASLLKDSEQILPLLRNELRGETTVQYDDGSVERIQVTKPVFVILDKTTNKPLKKKVTYKTGERWVYIPHDEAIEEVLSMMKMMGINRVTTLTNIDEDNILDDLLEFESKLAAVLCLKQKRWGIDKEMLPMIMTKIKTIVQDARYMACNGSTLKAIQKTVQRIESSTEGDKKSKGGFGPYFNPGQQ